MKPLLLLDVDGVISLFGFDSQAPPPGRWTNVEGVPHLLSINALDLVNRLEATFQCVWCTGWDEKASYHLPGRRPHVPIPDAGWKIPAIDAYVQPDRPLAWVDDRHDERHRAWAAARPGPTLLVDTEPALGLTEAHVERLEAWAAELSRSGRAATRRRSR